MIGQVVLGPRGPGANVFASPVRLGPPSVAHPVRVPDASLRDIAVFAQDEWTLRQGLSLVAAGLRGDFYHVATGATYARNALTGDIGLVANSDRRVRPFVRFGRSYRHPNLEEMLYAGPATAGNIAPNVKVAPETGSNVDAGATFRLPHASGGAYLSVNQYKNFVAQDLVVAATPAGPLAQATNYADVRIGARSTARPPTTSRRSRYWVRLDTRRAPVAGGWSTACGRRRRSPA